MGDNTLYWHDYETTGIDSVRDRPLQFAGIRTDEELNIIGEPLNIFCRLAPDTLPNPNASLITGITPQQSLSMGMSEVEFIARILDELDTPGTCGVGYNSMRFDDEVTRHTLYRNLHDPYAREWRNGNSRWDIIDMVRACHDLRPEGIVWPRREDADRPSFRLEQLSAANELGHENAHDALSDVYATIALARLIREQQPKLFTFLYGLRRKREVMKYIDQKELTPILHTSGMYGSDHGNTRLVVPIGPHPINKNSVIAFDLSQDPTILLDLGAKKLRERLFTPHAELPEGVERPALKQLISNKCPVVAPLATLNGEAAERLNIDLMKCQMNRRTLLNSLREIRPKIAEIFAPPDYEKQVDTDLLLYGGGFFSDGDKGQMDKIRNTASEELGGQTWVFDDQRLPEMLFRYRARNYPETLNADEQSQWMDHCRARIVDGEAGHMNLSQFYSEIERLRGEEALDGRAVGILGELEQFGREMESSLKEP